MDKYIIYCDGACSGNPGPGGWGSIVLDKKLNVKELAGRAASTTNNRMELTAALEALCTLPDNEKVIVLTDSVYVIRGITEWIFGWKKRGWKTAENVDVLNKDLWEKLFQQKQRLDIEWRYVRGHQGTAGNERVDELAVIFRDARSTSLYSGSLANYSFEIWPLPGLQEIPKSYGSSEKKQAICYLSVVNGKLERHNSWKECEARVKGRSGAKFKKATSEEEAQKILKEWGF